MTPAFSARRRADEFEALLDRPRGTPLGTRDAERYADLLGVVDELRAVPPVQARREFVSGLRERLMAEAETVLVPRPAGAARASDPLALPTSSRPRQRRLVALLGGAAVAGATASMAVAAQSALPGEALYPVKRAIESAELRLATDDAARGDALLSHAGDRLVELEGLATEDPAGASLLVADTLEVFESQASQGSSLLLDAYDDGDEAAAARVQDFTASSLEQLDRLQDQAPASARDELLAAGRTLVRVDEQVTVACPACSGGVAEVPDFLTQSLAPADLLGGLDSDQVGLGGLSVTGPAPVSGQDLTGLEVPDALKGPEVDPQQPLASPTPTPRGSTPLDDKVRETVTDTGDDVKDTTNEVTGTLDGLTGGAVGGLTGGLDDATGGLIGDLTGGVDDLTGNVLTDSTQGLLD